VALDQIQLEEKAPANYMSHAKYTNWITIP